MRQRHADQRRPHRAVDRADHPGGIGLEPEAVGIAVAGGERGADRLAIALERVDPRDEIGDGEGTGPVDGGHRLLGTAQRLGDDRHRPRDVPKRNEGRGRQRRAGDRRGGIGDRRGSRGSDRRRVHRGRIVGQGEIDRAELLERAHRLGREIASLAQHRAARRGRSLDQRRPRRSGEGRGPQYRRGDRQFVLGEQLDQRRCRRGEGQRPRARRPHTHRHRRAQRPQSLEDRRIGLHPTPTDEVDELPPRGLRAPRRGGIGSQDGLKTIVETQGERTPAATFPGIGLINP
jgi:hypothetical protein